MRKLSEMKSRIQGLESYSKEELIQQVRLKTEQVESELGPGEFRVKQITIIGSRTRSAARPDSDLDVLEADSRSMLSSTSCMKTHCI